VGKNQAFPDPAAAKVAVSQSSLTAWFSLEISASSGSAEGANEALRKRLRELVSGTGKGSSGDRDVAERVYLDWNATTPLRPEARAAMAAAFDLAGNPSSIHLEGRAARKLIEDARQQVGAALGAEPRNVIFTSGGTEANVLALQPGLASASGEPLRRLIVSAIEHVSVLSGGQFFSGGQIEIAPVTPEGVADLDKLRALLAGQPALVSVMLANNETGVIQPVSELAGLVHEAGGLLHVDAVQALGKVPIDIRALRADLVSVSAHKLGGPKGVGAVALAGDLQNFVPLLRGGGQERNRRAGTENVAGIAGFGAAVAAALPTLASEMPRLTRLRDRLESGLMSLGDAAIFGAKAPRLPNTTLFAAPGVRAETAVIAFDLEGIAVSSGSACSSGKVTPSHVLNAMQVRPELVQGAIRLSSGYLSSEADIERCLEAWRKLRGVLGRG
jgi:cysteine desulfurase